MNIPNSAPHLLQQIAEIQTMERGKLSVMRVTEEAIAGYQRYQTITEQYAQLKIQETRAAIATDSKISLNASFRSSALLDRLRMDQRDRQD